MKIISHNTTALSFLCFIPYTPGPRGISLYQKVIYIVDSVSVHVLLSKEKLWGFVEFTVQHWMYTHSHTHTHSHKLSLHVFAAFFPINSNHWARAAESDDRLGD